jgi:hypothetical protein
VRGTCHLHPPPIYPPFRPNIRNVYAYGGQGLQQSVDEGVAAGGKGHQ